MNVFYSSQISVSVQCPSKIDVKIQCVERKFSRDIAKMKEISLGKVILFQISMDKIQLSKRNQNSAKVISFGSPDSVTSGVSPMTPSFGAFTFSPRVLSETPTMSPMPRQQNSNDSRLSYFYMKNPKLPGQPETQWSLRYRLDGKI